MSSEDRVVIPDGYKQCTKCGEIKLAAPEFFSRDKSRKDGLYPQCKRCHAEYNAEHRAVNRDHYVELAAEYRAANRERRSEYMAKYRTAHRERIAERQVKYRAAHRERIAERKAKYNAEYFDSSRGKAANKMCDHRRRARKRNLPHTFTAQNWQRALDYFGDCCAVCGRPQGLWHTLAADHWIPLSDPRFDNPGTVPTNIVPLCHGEGGCNNRKNNHDPVEWLQSTFGARKAAKILSRIEQYFQWVKEQE